MENKEDTLYMIAASMYRQHDLSTTYYSRQIEKIISACLEELKKFPDIEINRFFVEQMILELI